MEIEKQKRNEMTQYTKTTWMLEVVGIPNIENENSKQVIWKVAELTGVTRFSLEEIDILHRISRGIPNLVMYLTG